MKNNKRYPIMKAAVLTVIKRDLEIFDDIIIPNLKKGQVLVKLAYSGVCHSQVMEIEGERGEDRYMPHLLGHEGTGVILDIGKGVTKVKLGDHVILGWIKGEGLDVSGTCYFTKDGMLINAGAITTFNDHAVVSENRCMVLPSEIPMDIGVLFGCSVPTGLGIVCNEIQPEQNSHCAVIGLGGIGLVALAALTYLGVQNIIAIDINSKKLELAIELGAHHTINASSEDPLTEVLKLTKGKGVDYSIDSAGQISTIELAFNLIKFDGGLCVFASHPANGGKISIDPHHLIRGKRIRGSWGGSVIPDKDIPLFIEMYLKGKIPLKKLIGRRYSLEQINTAIMDLKNGTVIRPLIEINSGL